MKWCLRTWQSPARCIPFETLRRVECHMEGFSVPNPPMAQAAKNSNLGECHLSPNPPGVFTNDLYEIARFPLLPSCRPFSTVISDFLGYLFLSFRYEAGREKADLECGGAPPKFVHLPHLWEWFQDVQRGKLPLKSARVAIVGTRNKQKKKGASKKEVISF